MDVRGSVLSHGGDRPRQGDHHTKPSNTQLRAIAEGIAEHAQVRAEIRYVTRQIEEASRQSGEIRRVLTRSGQAVAREEDGLTGLTARTTRQVVDRMDARLRGLSEELRELYAWLLRIEGLLSMLDIQERAVIHARLIEGRNWPHIAYDTHISERQCLRIQQRGLAKICRALARERAAALE